MFGFVWFDILVKVSLCNSPGYSGTDFVDQADLKLRDPPYFYLLSSDIKGMYVHHTGPCLFVVF